MPPDRHPLPAADVVVRGLRLRVARLGSPRRPPVLLVHGFGTSSQLWRDVVRDLAREQHVVAPDLLGCGCSERSNTASYRLADQASLLLELLDSQDDGRVVVCGHGLGGAVAVHMFALAPERVSSLVLVDAVVHPQLWPVPGALAVLAPGTGTAAALLRHSPWAAERFIAGAIGAKGAPGTEPFVREAAAVLREPGAARALVRFARSVDLGETERAWELVRSFAPPTLLMWGADDRLAPAAYGRRLGAELASAQCVPVPDAGHLLPWQRPERVAEEVAAFVAEVV